ncbi:MAG: TonB-dependent receptor [Pseudomonadota bacterium]
MKIQLFSSAAAIAVLSSSVLAQENASEGPAELASLDNQIVVVGQKIARSIEDVTASVDVIGAEEIAREPIVDLYEIVDRIPNVSAALGQQGFVVRGVDQRGVGGSSLTVTVFVDDSPLGNQTTFFGPLDSWDLGQVEVYRGPQSTNFGRNSIAGAIYIRTQDPTYEWDTRARVEVGNNDTIQAAGAFGGALIDDVLAFRASVSHRQSDGFIYNTFLDREADETELTTGRFKLLFEPMESLSIISTTSYTEHFAGEDILDPTNGVPGALLDASDVDRTVAYNVPGLEGTETFIQSLSASWDISDAWNLKSITTYQESDYFRLEDFRTDASNPDDNPSIALDRTGDDKVITQELRLSYESERLTAVLGGYYLNAESGFDDSFTLTGAILGNPALDFILLTRDGESFDEVTNKAVFFDGEFQLTDKFDLLFGFRYDNEDQNDRALGNTFIANPDDVPVMLQAMFAPFLGVVEPETEASYDAFLPKGGVRYTINDNANLAFVVQRAYRAGGADVDFVSSGIIVYDPEYLMNYELAARTNFFDGRLSWNTNFYYSDYSDQQVTQAFPPPLQNFSFTVNAGESELFGFETDASFQVTPEWQVYGGVGFSHTEFIEFTDTNGTSFNGNRYQYAPRWSANAGVSYDSEMGLFGGVDANYQSDQYANNFNEPEDFEGERVVVNARLGYRVTENLTVTALARNILNTDYYVFANRGVFGSENARLGDPRTWSVRLDLDL